MRGVHLLKYIISIMFIIEWVKRAVFFSINFFVRIVPFESVLVPFSVLFFIHSMKFDM